MNKTIRAICFNINDISSYAKLHGSKLDRRQSVHSLLPFSLIIRHVFIPTFMERGIYVNKIHVRTAIDHISYRETAS